jgi:flagellar biosynthesis/type III secretory pathway protein FliH
MALNNMPGDFIIKPWLEANRKGVRNMLLTEYNEEETMQLFKEEYLNKGRKEGLDEGRKEGRDEGRKEGRDEGRKEGRDEGYDKLSSLIKELMACGKSADIERVVTDPEYRDKLIEDMGLNKW